jgi:hypothetical protein
MSWTLLLLASAFAADPHLPTDSTPDKRLHLRLDTDATWGIGGQMFLGAQAQLTGYAGVWRGARATGSLDVGLQLAYGNEATFLAPWIDPETTTGATHRVQLVATLGHTFHMGPQRRVSLGLQWFAGWNHWRSDYAMTIEEADIDEQAVVVRNLVTTGGQVTLAYRASKHVGVNLVITAPVPTPSSYAVGMVSVGVGPTFYLR